MNKHDGPFFLDGDFFLRGEQGMLLGLNQVVKFGES